MNVDSATRQIYEHTVSTLLSTSGRLQRGAEVRRVAELLGVSEQTVWRNLQKVGWDSGRKERSDKGESAVSVDDCRLVARIVAQGRNKRGEPNTPTTEAWRIAREQGLPAGQVSPSTLLRRMRQEGMDITRMRAPEPSIVRVSKHPNHVWFCDQSVAVPFFFKDANGKYLDQYLDAGARFYLGKIENVKAIRRLVWRYVVVDHFSGAFQLRYYNSAGENFEDMADNLCRAMSPSPLGDLFPFRGIPRRIVSDQGPAFKNQVIRNLLGPNGLGIDIEMHQPGNAKANGMVEVVHDIIQRSFEGRLKLRAVNDIDEINRLAEPFCARMNAERPHSRHGLSRLEKWSTITADQLIECPDRQTFFRLAATDEDVGTLDNHLWLRRGGRTWLLRGKDLYPGQKIRFRLTPFGEAGIRAWDSEGREVAAEEIRFDPISGFAENGHRHVWDDENAKGATVPAPEAQRIARAITRGEDKVTIESVFDTGPSLSFLVPTGQTWCPPAATTLEEELIGSLDAREEISRKLGRPLGKDGAWWRERLGTGVTRTQLERLWSEFCRPAEAELQEVSG